MVGLKEWMEKSGSLISMVLVQVFMTGLQLLSRIILNNGTFIFALMTYRHIVAAVFVTILALIMERGLIKKITWEALGWIFVNSIFGISLAMSMYYYGLRDTTATYATNFFSMIPVVTFVFSTIFRLEKLWFGSKSGNAKIAGTIICVGGALTYGLYRGKSFYMHHPKHHNSDISSQVLHNINTNNNATIQSTPIHHNWLRGSFMLVGNCLSLSAWFIIQVKMAKVYSSHYWTTAISCIMASFQCMVVGLILDRSGAAWQLGWNLQLITIIYSGVLSSGATFCLVLWTVKKRGPTYPPMFNPLSLVFVAISEAIIFNEPITVGGILGMLMIIIGLYTFLWGMLHEPPVTPSLPNTNNTTEPAVGGHTVPFTTLGDEREF